MTRQNKIHRFNVKQEKGYKFVLRHIFDSPTYPRHFKRTRHRTRFIAAYKRYQKEDK